MSAQWKRFGGLLLHGSVLVMFLAAFLGCGDEQQAAPPPAKPPAFPVRVAKVTKQEVARSATLVGTAEPRKRSVVASEIAGLVDQFPVDEGDFVKRGQLLARLGTQTLQIQHDSAVASRAEWQVRHEQAKLDLVRVKTLFEKELVTRKEHEDAIAEELALRQRLAQLDAEIRQVEDRLAKSSILAPFAGWIIEERTEIGQWVEEGGPVVEMVDLSRVRIAVPLPDRYIQHVQRGDPVSAVFDGLPGFEAEGHVFSIVAQANEASRTFPIKVEVPNQDLRIKSGMAARVTLSLGQAYPALVVPKDALVLRGGNEFIFVVQDGRAVQKRVRPGLYTNGLVEVAGDVQEGMRVVILGNERLLPGQQVRILD